MSLPGEDEEYYRPYFWDIANFAFEMDLRTKGRDHLFIVHDETGRKYFQNRTFTHAHFIEMAKPSMDAWMRDFTPAMPNQQVKFTYKPQYLTAEQAKFDEERFKTFATLVGLPSLKHSNIILEGGNIVENGDEIAITTERAYHDNPNISHQELVKTLEAAINRKVVVIPDPGDATGHVDGVASFVEKNTVLVGLVENHPNGKAIHDNSINAILKVFPNLTVVTLPSYWVNTTTWDGFTSAEGCYANSLVTYNAVYLPFFSNQTGNERAFAVFKNSTTKEVIPVYNTGTVPVLGGSLRCMTWQIDENHPVAQALFEYVKKNTSPSGSASVITAQIAWIAAFVLIAFALASSH